MGKQNKSFKKLGLVPGFCSSLSDFFSWLISWFLLILENVLLEQPFYKERLWCPSATLLSQAQESQE